MANKDNDITILHNNRCRKSRETLALLNSYGLEPTIVAYLDDTPTKSELKSILKKLGMKAKDLIRKSEPIFKEAYKGKELSEQQWVEAMAKHPKLIERPIVINGDKAVIGRPPENIKEII